MDETARFTLPLLSPGQGQKEFFHNEALQRIDTLLCPVVEGPPSSSPPANPALGRCYLIGVNAAGAWAGEDDSLACFTEGGWRFIAPVDAMRVVDRASGQMMSRRGTIWEAGILRAQEVRIGEDRVVSARQPAIVNPSGGTVADAECRLAVGAMLTALRTHGLIA